MESKLSGRKISTEEGGERGEGGAERYVTHKILRWKRHLRHLARTKVSIFLRVLYPFLFFFYFSSRSMDFNESREKVRELFLREVVRYLGNI